MLFYPIFSPIYAIYTYFIHYLLLYYFSYAAMPIRINAIIIRFLGVIASQFFSDAVQCRAMPPRFIGIAVRLFF